MAKSKHFAEIFLLLILPGIPFAHFQEEMNIDELEEE